MSEKSAKRQKKATISEQDGASLLQRYTLKTVLAVLHEVSQCTEEKKIDWNALVQKTTTGISSAREYQMLWRHLAYRDTLLDKLEDDAQPMDDDSDLECELEVFPSVNSEASAEAAACVKVLIASAKPSDSNPNGSIVEAPLTVNIPNFHSCRNLEQPSCSMEGTNVVVPVYVQKQPAPAATVADGLDKRKRKPWSEAEDLELIAAVQKCGEGNWAHMLRGDFKGDRTASQLSQRWGIIRKKHVNLTAGSNTNGPQLSESQLATSRALFLALDMPRNNLTSNTISGAGTVGGYRSGGTSSRNNSARTNGTNNTQPASSVAENSTTGNKLNQQSQKQSQENQTSKPGLSGPAEKPRATMKKTLPKPTPTPNSSDAMVRATAVAAGARIASASDAESLLKAAQAKNAVHIMPSSSGSIKSTMPGGVSENLPNVHYIRTGLARTPLSNYAAATPSIPVKPVPPQARPLPTNSGTSSDVQAKQNIDVSSTLPRQLSSSSKEIKTTEVASVPESVSSAAKVQVQGTATRVPEKSQEVVQDIKMASSAPSQISLLASKAAEAKSTNGGHGPVSLTTLKKAEVKAPNSVPNSPTLLTLKKAEAKAPNGVPNSPTLLTLKKAEVKAPNGVPNSVTLSTSKKAEVKGPNSVPNSVMLSTSKKIEVKGPNDIPNPVILSTSMKVVVKGTHGIPNTVSLSTSKTTEVKSTNGAPKPVSVSTSKPAEVKCTISTPNPVSSSATLKTTENSKQVIVVTQPKKAVENGNGNKVSGFKPQACTTKDMKVEQYGQKQIENMEVDCRSVVANDMKISQNTEKMEVDIPSIVKAVEKIANKHPV